MMTIYLFAHDLLHVYREDTVVQSLLEFPMIIHIHKIIMNDPTGGLPKIRSIPKLKEFLEWIRAFNPCELPRLVSLIDFCCTGNDACACEWESVRVWHMHGHFVYHLTWLNKYELPTLNQCRKVLTFDCRNNWLDANTIWRTPSKYNASLNVKYTLLNTW